MKGHSTINYTKSEVDEHGCNLIINNHYYYVAQKIKGALECNLDLTKLKKTI